MRIRLHRSPQRIHPVRVTLVAVASLTLVLGCRNAPTENDPFIRGTISSISGSEVRIAQGSSCGAIAGVTGETAIERANGDQVPFRSCDEITD